MKNKYLAVSGKTINDRLVVAGVGEMCFTAGVPLELILHVFKDKALVVDWIDYINTALRDGHKPNNIRSRIEAAVTDVHNKDYSNEVMKRIRRYL